MRDGFLRKQEYPCSISSVLRCRVFCFSLNATFAVRPERVEGQVRKLALSWFDRACAELAEVLTTNRLGVTRYNRKTLMMRQKMLTALCLFGTM